MEFKKSDILKKIKKFKNNSEPEKETEATLLGKVDSFDITSMFYNSAPDDINEDNVIVGEKTGTTMTAEVMMERQGDENGKVLSTEKKLPEYSPDMFSSPEPMENVVLQGYNSEDAIVSEDVIEDVPQFDIKPIEIKDIETIDIEIPEIEPEHEDIEFALEQEEFDEEKYKQESLDELIKRENLPPLPVHEEDKEIEEFQFEKLFGKQKPVPKGTTQVSRVPIYTPESSLEKLNVNVGKFSVVVRQEYEEYLKSKNPEISATYKPTETVVTEKIYTEKRGFMNNLMDFFSVNPDDDKEPKTTAEKVVTVDDFDSSDDIDSVKEELKENKGKLRFQCFSMGILTTVSFIMMIIQRALPESLGENMAGSLIYGVMNFIVILCAGFVSRVAVKNGLFALKSFKGNSDTAVSVALAGAGIAGIVGLFFSQDFFGGNYSYYTIIVMLGLLGNALGKLLMVTRVERNFKFLIQNPKVYSAKIYTDESIASKMMSGTVIEKPIIAYQHKTGFLTNYLQLSYAPDPSEEASGKIAPYTTACAVIVAILYGIMAKTFVGAVAALSLFTAVSVPVCVLMAVNFPLKSLCKRLVRRGAMLSGYQGVKQFCDTSAIMVDASELYPEGSVILNKIQAFEESKLDESCVCAAAVLREVNSPLAPVFDNALQESRMVLPDVESVMYEDQLGLVGWVNGDRILVGNRDLMNKYSIKVPNENYEEKYHRQHKQVTFIAHSGRLTAMLITTYRPSVEIAKELQRAEYNGISLLISTSDCNITSEQISEDFGVFYRSVKVLPTGLGNVCKEVSSVYTDKSRAYLATKGRFTQMARTISGCVQLRSNINLAVIIQLIGIILGILIMATITLYAGTTVIGTLEMFLYSLFWGAATMIAPSIKRP